jgi:glycosyltransferase involved in cell wall biosynthesis
MKIAFVSLSPWDYQIETVYQKPLGGTQSALCYLAEQLALSNHQVLLLNNTSKATVSRNVICYPLQKVSKSVLSSLDYLIIQNTSNVGYYFRSLLPKHIPVILWIHHDCDQPAMQGLKEQKEKDAYDYFVFISDWQRQRYAQFFGIDLAKSKVLRNAISPRFENLFPRGDRILNYKPQPLTLAYTSTPFRGLEILLEVFPSIREAIPHTILKVFSSMKVYQVNQEDDRAKYGKLYQICEETEGIEYIGSIPQPELAQQLKSVHILAYPNSFPETSCIAVMEAMASGCYIVTSHLGALPDTSAGFARLIPMEGYWENYQENFLKETVEVLRQYQGEKRDNLENHLREQVDFVNKNYTWYNRTQEWLECLTEMKAQNYLTQENYQDLINFCEQEITISPQINNNYWYLGLGLLLSGDEITAQTTWMSVIFDSNGEAIESRQRELLQMLETEVKRLKAKGDRDKVELLKTYIEELSS